MIQYCIVIVTTKGDKHHILRNLSNETVKIIEVKPNDRCFYTHLRPHEVFESVNPVKMLGIFNMDNEPADVSVKII